MTHVLFLIPVAGLMVSTGAISPQAAFDSARPVWPEGKDRARNVTAGFRAVFEAPPDTKVALRVTGSTLYRAFVNGEFCGHGPARGPHGWFRVDEWDLTARLASGTNVVAIEVAGYNANSYYLLDQPAFLQAEVVADSVVLASTGGEGAAFAGAILPDRLQRVERYSFQRPFMEVYRLGPGYDAWRTDPAAAFEPSPCPELEAKNLLPRGVPYPDFTVRPALEHIASGLMAPRTGKFPIRKDRHLTGIGPQLGGFPENELETIPSIELQKLATESAAAVGGPLSPETRLALGKNAFHILDFGTNLTGFLGATITCTSDARVLFTFDEILSNEDVDFLRLGCINIVAYELAKGTYTVEAFEPYTLRYLKAICLEGDCEITNVYLREYVNPDTGEARFAASDERLNRLFAAGVETFRQNAVDVFMDCPSRERAGWLCDSFFTARAAKDLSGDAAVEKNFFENYLLPQEFAHLPDGMLPMCYPADHYNGTFIPNWALWFVVQLEEYLARSGDRQMVEALEPKVLALFDYFEPFENEDGLLERLESWIFVEWSKANQFVRDVNYPTNMLYAGALAAAGRMFGMAELAEQANKIRQTVRRQSFDGAFFVDNAVRKKGTLEVTRNRSEVCQYFAFFFDLANPETDPELWQKLRDQFGPDRKQTKVFSEVHEANSFVGNMLRVEILSRYGRCQQILDESIDYLLYMAERTGTLWENVHDRASCNHGFASHIVHTLYRDILGLYRVDTVNKSIRLRFTDLDLTQCQGVIPTPDGPIALTWRVEGDKRTYTLTHPQGYTVQTENLSSKELDPQDR